MKLKRSIIPLFSLLLIVSGLTVSLGNAQITTMQSNWASNVPTIDGNFTASEWADASHYSFNHTTPSPGHDPDFVHFYIKNTADKLYILIDDLPDNTTETEDHLYVYFDLNYDNVTDDNISMYLDRDHVPDSYLGNSLAEWAFGFGTTSNKDSNHTVIEVAINITLTSTYDGSSAPPDMGYKLPVGNTNYTIRIMLSAAIYICGWEQPQDGDTGDPTTYTDLTLAASPPLDPVPIVIVVVVGGVVAVAAVFIFLKRR